MVFVPKSGSMDGSGRCAGMVSNSVIMSMSFWAMRASGRTSALKALSDWEIGTEPAWPSWMPAAISMLGIGLSLFKKCEREGRFPFKRKMVGTCVKYRNTDLVDYINSNENPDEK